MNNYLILADRRLDIEQFGKDLAAALGFNTIIDHPGSSYPTVQIDCGDDLTLMMRAEYGAKLGKVEIYASAKGTHVLEQYERPKMPSAGIDTSRDIAALAKDVSRRVIEPARDAVTEARAAIAKRAECISGLQSLAKSLEREFPGLQVVQRSPNDKTASLYFNKNGCYLNGSMYADGVCHFERISLSGHENARRLFALIANAS